MTGDHTVLVVDDEQEITDTYSELLDDRYTVEVSNSGEQDGQASGTRSPASGIVLICARLLRPRVKRARFAVSMGDCGTVRRCSDRRPGRDAPYSP